MLALCGFEACIRPEWGTHACPPGGITRPRSVSGIRATPAPAGLEREPGATGDRLETVFLCFLLFLLPFLQHGELLLLLIGALFPFVQLAGFRFDLAAAARAEEVRHRFISRVQLPAAFPAIPGEDVLLVVDCLKLREQVFLWFQDGLAPRDLLLAHHWMPLASKGPGERVGEDGNHSRRAAFCAALHPAGDIAMPVDEDHFGFGPRSAHLGGVLLGHLLGRADQHGQRLRTCLLRWEKLPVLSAIGRDAPTRSITHGGETEHGQCARVLEPRTAQASHPGRLRLALPEERRVAVPPVVRLARGCSHSEPCLPSTWFALNGRASSRIEGATHGVDAVLLRQRETGKRRVGQLLILPELGDHTEFPVFGIEPVERLALLHHTCGQRSEPGL